jgi:putative FmdB family regulatory protein
MPIYEYQCPSCNRAFEKMVKLGAANPPCPECGGEEVRKRISATSFVLKGGGWYRDHYGLKKSGGSESSGSESSSSDAAAATSGAAAAPAASAPAAPAAPASAPSTGGGS